MNLHLFIISILLFLTASMNGVYFIKKRQQKKDLSQLFLLSLYLIFAIFAILRIIISLTEINMDHFFITLSLTFTSLLLSAGLSLEQKYLAAKLVTSIGIFIAIIYLLILFIIAPNNPDFGENAYFTMLAISGILTISGDIILFKFFIKSKLSALLGLFLGMLIPTIVFLIAIVVPAIAEDIPATYMLILINIIMYLGFTDKLNFFE